MEFWATTFWATTFWADTFWGYGEATVIHPVQILSAPNRRIVAQAPNRPITAIAPARRTRSTT